MSGISVPTTPMLKKKEKLNINRTQQFNMEKVLRNLQSDVFEKKQSMKKNMLKR